MYWMTFEYMFIGVAKTNDARDPRRTESAGSSAAPLFGDGVCSIRTHPARWGGRDGISWQPGRPGTQTQRRPSAQRAGSSNDALLNRGRQSLCNEDSLQSKHICSL